MSSNRNPYVSVLIITTKDVVNCSSLFLWTWRHSNPHALLQAGWRSLSPRRKQETKCFPSSHHKEGFWLLLTHLRSFQKSEKPGIIPTGKPSSLILKHFRNALAYRGLGGSRQFSVFLWFFTLYITINDFNWFSQCN